MQQNICLSKFVSQIECFFYIEFAKLNVAHYVNFTLHIQCLQNIFWAGKVQLLSHVQGLVDVDPPAHLAVLVHAAHLVQGVSKMLCSFHPR